jgi:hypothetical protein
MAGRDIVEHSHVFGRGEDAIHVTPMFLSLCQAEAVMRARGRFFAPQFALKLSENRKNWQVGLARLRTGCSTGYSLNFLLIIYITS